MNGLNIAKKISLKICECKKIFAPVTCEISLSDVENLVKENFKNPRAIFVAWQIQNIVWGKFDGEKFFSTSEVTPQFWLECRIFNDDEEIHLKRIENKLRGRYVSEIEGAGDFYADSFSRFWGENKGSANGFIKLCDNQRKLFMEIPCERKSNWYGLLTRNYISSDEKTGLSGYADYRFVAIEPAEEGAKIG